MMKSMSRKQSSEMCVLMRKIIKKEVKYTPELVDSVLKKESDKE